MVTGNLQFLHIKSGACWIKYIFMPVSTPIVSLTSNLLAGGAFSHLTDEEVSGIHHMVLRLQQPLSTEQVQIMLGFWQYADVATISSALLHRCNAMRYQFGLPPMEDIGVELSYQ
jgi:hypothetical protein